MKESIEGRISNEVLDPSIFTSLIPSNHLRLIALQLTYFFFFLLLFLFTNPFVFGFSTLIYMYVYITFLFLVQGSWLHYLSLFLSPSTWSIFIFCKYSNLLGNLYETKVHSHWMIIDLFFSFFKSLNFDSKWPLL